MSAREMAITEAGNVGQPLVVLLHGAGIARWMWQPQLGPLAARYHVLAPDMPGCGESLGCGSFTLEVAATEIAELIHARRYGPAHIIGLSLGAMVAVQMCATAPDVVASLVLSGGQVHPPRVLMDLQETIVRCLPERMVTNPLPREFRQRYPQLVEQARQDARQMGKRGLLALLRRVGRADLRAILPSIGVPTLVLCGARDRANQPAARQLAAGIPGARLRIIADAGHVWNLEQPDVFNRVVLDFLSDVAEEARAR